MSVRTKIDGPVAMVIIDRVEAHNALNEGIIRQIGEAIDGVARSSARALVFIGAGQKAFCAGADVKDIEGRNATARRAVIAFGQTTFAKLDRLTIPSIAVIHGLALGGGLELAMACTYRVATPTARMGLPEIKLGLIPGYGGTQRLPRLVGAAKAMELLMSGRIIDAAEADRIGLLNAVIAGDNPEQIGREFAGRFVDMGRNATALVLEAVDAATHTSLSEGLEVETELVSRALASHEAAEGMAAFLEKRPPRFHPDDAMRSAVS